MWSNLRLRVARTLSSLGFSAAPLPWRTRRCSEEVEQTEEEEEEEEEEEVYAASLTGP